MSFDPKRLIMVREKLGINKAEAAKRLNMSAMGYGRYENGQRNPSYQTICYIAQIFHTTPEYLCGESKEAVSDIVTFRKSENSEMYAMIESMSKNENLAEKIIAYYKKLMEKE